MVSRGSRCSPTVEPSMSTMMCIHMYRHTSELACLQFRDIHVNHGMISPMSNTRACTRRTSRGTLRKGAYSYTMQQNLQRDAATRYNVSNLKTGGWPQYLSEVIPSEYANVATNNFPARHVYKGEPIKHMCPEYRRVHDT